MLILRSISYVIHAFNLLTIVCKMYKCYNYNLKIIKWIAIFKTKFNIVLQINRIKICNICTYIV